MRTKPTHGKQVLLLFVVCRNVCRSWYKTGVGWSRKRVKRKSGGKWPEIDYSFELSPTKRGMQLKKKKEEEERGLSKNEGGKVEDDIWFWAKKKKKVSECIYLNEYKESGAKRWEKLKNEAPENGSKRRWWRRRTKRSQSWRRWKKEHNWRLNEDKPGSGLGEQTTGGLLVGALSSCLAPFGW